MDQATAPAPTTSTPPPDTDSFQHAAAVAAEVVGPLTCTPSSVRLEPNWPSGWSVVLTFLSDQVGGLDDIATALGVPITTAYSGTEIHLEVCTRVHDVEVRAFTLVSRDQFAELQSQDERAPDDTADADVDQAPDVIHVPATPTADQDGDA
ncbi:hypothetical protein RM863_29170 [Streptomyces sp. DSM 41014]|uniref:Uncharacterized protein n=1 Tax=Streptomyces hintoniae TaxID=3075521 RepID=A0ABU2USV2_9ACTN|nr:hypothetical protein [Streptomyces sp. DSM 41014]MDT0476203.1 hypothetical protein [Streptomyces sp. DSM 41014]